MVVVIIEVGRVGVVFSCVGPSKQITGMAHKPQAHVYLNVFCCYFSAAPGDFSCVEKGAAMTAASDLDVVVKYVSCHWCVPPALAWETRSPITFHSSSARKGRHGRRVTITAL